MKIYLSLFLFIGTPFLSPVQAQQLSSRSSWSSSGAVSKEGKLFVWGDNFQGQLGVGTNQNIIDPPKEVVLPEVTGGWKDVSPTFAHTFALTKSGMIYASGSNYSGSLSIPGSTVQIHSFQKIVSPVSVTSWKAVSTSAHFSLALSSDGRAFAVGLHMFRQSLTDTMMEVPCPDDVTAWKQVSAGESYAMLLSENGRLFTWGGNAYGRLGVDSSYTGETFSAQVLYPVLLPEGVDGTVFEFTNVVTSFEHTLAIGNDGNLYAAGNNTHLQLGQSDADAAAHRMTLVPKPNGSATWIRAAAGRNYSVGLMSDGALYRIGGTPFLKFLPADLSEGFSWKDVAANDYHFYALGSNGTVYVSSTNLVVPHLTVLQPYFTLDKVSSAPDETSHPRQFTLHQNYPNPFNPSTTIGFTLQVSGLTTLKIYDAIGREVATLVNEELEAGVFHKRLFEASHLSAGVYFTRLVSGTTQKVSKMLFAK